MPFASALSWLSGIILVDKLAAGREGDLILLRVDVRGFPTSVVEAIDYTPFPVL
jgi:hypothetical protein